MRVHFRYLTSLALAAGLINFWLALSRQDNLAIYFITNVIAYLAITLLYTYLNPKAKSALNTVTIILVAGFIIIIIVQVLEILLG